MRRFATIRPCRVSTLMPFSSGTAANWDRGMHVYINSVSARNNTTQQPFSILCVCVCVSMNSTQLTQPQLHSRIELVSYDLPHFRRNQRQHKSWKTQSSFPLSVPRWNESTVVASYRCHRPCRSSAPWIITIKKGQLEKKEKKKKKEILEYIEIAKVLRERRDVVIREKRENVYEIEELMKTPFTSNRNCVFPPISLNMISFLACRCWWC